MRSRAVGQLTRHLGALVVAMTLCTGPALGGLSPATAEPARDSTATAYEYGHTPMTVRAISGGGGSLPNVRSSLPDSSGGCVHNPFEEWTFYKQSGSYAGRKLVTVGAPNWYSLAWYLDGKGMRTPDDSYKPAGGGWTDSPDYYWEYWHHLPFGALSAGKHTVRAVWDEYDAGGSGYRVTWEASGQFEVCPKTPPSAPPAVTAKPGNASATVSWGSADGNGAPITGYSVKSVPGGLTCVPYPVTATTCTINSLANGTPYTFEVVAKNMYGTSTPGTSAPVTPGTPAAPTGVHGTVSDRSSVVSWNPSTTYGSAITGYTVTSSGGQGCSTAGTLSCTVSGLANGTPYRFMVKASSAAGSSAWSTASSEVVPAARPTAPGNVRAERGNASATLTWSPSTSDGTTIREYVIRPNPNPNGREMRVAGTTTATMLGLTNGTPYSFTVTATSSGGVSDASAPSNIVTPATLPGAATGVRAQATDGGATLTWSPAPANGAAISKYTITIDPSGRTVGASGTASSALIDGLTNGTPYQFTVRATNELGDGPMSAGSNIITPSATPATASPVPSGASPSVSPAPTPSRSPSASMPPSASASPSAVASPTAPASARWLSPVDGQRFAAHSYVDLDFEIVGAVDHAYCRISHPDGRQSIINPCATGHRVFGLANGTHTLGVRGVPRTGEAAPEHSIRIAVGDGPVPTAPPTAPAPGPTRAPSTAPTQAPGSSTAPTSAPTPTHLVPRVTVNPYVVKFGQTANVTVHGTPGAVVDLYVRKYRGDFTLIRSGLVLDRSGAAVVSTRPDMNLRFQARDRTLAEGSPVGGADGLMTVQKYVSINVTRTATRQYTFSGSINPPHPGATVNLYRNGVLVRSGIPVSSQRTYSFTASSLPVGTYGFEVRSPTTGYNNASSSPVRQVRVS